MKGAAALLGTLAMAPALCQPTTATPDPATSSETDAPPTAAITPEAERGDAVDVTVPLYRDGLVRTTDLRDKVVVLEVFSPDEADWGTEHLAWHTLQQDNPEAVVIVTVATASEDTNLVASWDSEPPRYLVGWDPQGALALRLGVDVLPTVLVLDAQGRIVAKGQDRAALLRAAESLL